MSPRIWWTTPIRCLSPSMRATARPCWSSVWLPEARGKVIGRQGRIAKEIRTLIRSVAQRTGQRVSVEIVD